MLLLRTELCALAGEPLRRPEGLGINLTLVVIPNRIADDYGIQMPAITHSMLSHLRLVLLNMAAW